MAASSRITWRRLHAGHAADYLDSGGGSGVCMSGRDGLMVDASDGNVGSVSCTLSTM